MTLLTLVLFSVGAGQNALACADMDGDTHADVLVADERSASLSFWKGNGTGQLERGHSIKVAANPSDLVIADLNADKHPDLVIAHHELNLVTVHSNNGAGKLRESFKLTPNVSPHPHVVRLADIDADQKLDILVDDRAGDGLKVFFGDGEGRFGDKTASIDLDGDPYLGFAVGDIDKDGLPDIAAPVSGRLTVTTGPTSKRVNLATTSPTFAVALLDINNDGHLDVLAASHNKHAPPQRFDGDGTGQWQAAGNYPALSPGAKKIVTADLHGDGTRQAVIVNWSGGVTVVDAKGAHSLEASIKHPWGITVCDLNKDGADDVILSDGETSQAQVVLGHPK